MVQRLQAVGGAVPFRTFMEWALHDPDHGAYGTGRLRVGPLGDFATSPSLGPAFADLLAPQLAEWLQALGPGPLALVETGPGEGDLARQLAAALALGWPALAARLELVLVEPNAGMADRQKQRLAGAPLPVRWCDWQELATRPLRGVMLAHEVLDALAVERVVWDGALWRQQQVALEAAGDLVLAPGATVADWAQAQLQALGLAAAGPAQDLPAGWCSELHPGLEPWLGAAAAAMAEGVLLVVDYALETRRYYSPQRSSGTLMAYQGQQASPDPLRQPGHWDLTAHLCLESLERAAAAAGWQGLGSCRQGQALLALGLAGALHGLQQPGSGDLAERLARREALLRLVDPVGLGEFRWIALGRGAAACAQTPRFLREPEG
jgi:SAM-dependent MidA family methyltransferase